MPGFVCVEVFKLDPDTSIHTHPLFEFSATQSLCIAAHSQCVCSVRQEWKTQRSICKSAKNTEVTVHASEDQP